jgi:hypothetical protein
MAIFAFLECSPARADIVGETKALLTRELDSLKDEFESDLQGVSDQGRIAALSVRAGARAWAVAAAAVSSPEDEVFPRMRLERFQAMWDKEKGSWPSKEKAALRTYFESMGRLAAKLTDKRKDPGVNADLTNLFSGATYSSFRRARTLQARLAEDRVFWSNRLDVLATMLIRLKCPETAEALDDVVEDMLNRAEVISRRTDVHYQARMELLYLNNSQSLARMLFLMGKSPSSPVVAEAEALERAWLKHLADGAAPVSDLSSVTWVANAQMAFPLAWWVAADLLD